MPPDPIQRKSSTKPDKKQRTPCSQSGNGFSSERPERTRTLTTISRIESTNQPPADAAESYFGALSTADVLAIAWKSACPPDRPGAILRPSLRPKP